MTCPECGSKNVSHKSLSYWHECRDCHHRYFDRWGCKYYKHGLGKAD